MIEARKWLFFERWFSRQVEKRIRSTFSCLHVCGLELMQRHLQRQPVIVVSNHSSFWDPMFLIVLSHRILQADGYAMMLERELLRRPFLGRVGGFGIRPADPIDVARALRYAARLLSCSGRLVWVFPQGRERPITAPLEFGAGGAYLSRLAPQAAVLPVAMQYVFGEESKPIACVSIGESVAARAAPEELVEIQRRAVREELQRIDAHLCGAESSDGFVPMLVERRRDSLPWPERLLTWVTSYR